MAWSCYRNFSCRRRCRSAPKTWAEGCLLFCFWKGQGCCPKSCLPMLHLLQYSGNHCCYKDSMREDTYKWNESDKQWYCDAPCKLNLEGYLVHRPTLAANHWNFPFASWSHWKISRESRNAHLLNLRLQPLHTSCKEHRICPRTTFPCCPVHKCHYNHDLVALILFYDLGILQLASNCSQTLASDILWRLKYRSKYHCQDQKLENVRYQSVQQRGVSTISKEKAE